jgi:beta-glucosidase
LKGFKRISLEPNETQTVVFEITPHTLSRWIEGKGFSVESDEYILMVGSSSRDKDLKKITLKVD